MMPVRLSRGLLVAVATLGIGLVLGGCGRATTSLTAGAPSTAEAVSETTSILESAGMATAPPATTLSTSPTAGMSSPASTATAPPRSPTPPSPISPPAGTGAYGYVTAGPTCPVERPDQPCPPRPVSAQVNAQDASGHTVATTRTDQAGRYSLSLAAGTYTLIAVTGTTYPRCQPTPVTVHSGGPTRADVSCDTGIR